MCQFNRVVIGNVTKCFGKQQMLRERGVKVEILEDQQGIDLYAKYREKPDHDKEDWKGLAEVLKARKGD
jgi:cytosine/creatinine deaminase